MGESATFPVGTRVRPKGQAHRAGEVISDLRDENYLLVRWDDGKGSSWVPEDELERADPLPVINQQDTSEQRKAMVQRRAYAQGVYREDEELRTAQARALHARIDALERLLFLVQFASGSDELERLRRDYSQHIAATRYAFVQRNPVVPLARYLLEELEHAQDGQETR